MGHEGQVVGEQAVDERAEVGTEVGRHPLVRREAGGTDQIPFLIDHRFYRRKYNAMQTVEAFSAALRQETDLAALRSELLGVVHQTIQPASAAVWLRGERPV